jgi:hypothetical protein
MTGLRRDRVCICIEKFGSFQNPPVTGRKAKKLPGGFYLPGNEYPTKERSNDDEAERK